ncbi:MAG: lysophospholipid acyltransferase family protein [Bacteroidales bacterium]|nr:lysophospholipid acyltransferase family protein [Bacteroidales bacterium]
MPFITKSDLILGKKGFTGKIISEVAAKMLRIKRLNWLYDNGLPKTEGETLSGNLLSLMGTSYSVFEYDKAKIPQKGAAIVVANHPTGAMDGVLLIDLLSSIRPDVKFMTNFLLNYIEGLKPFFISVDPFDSASKARNVAGFREALKHLNDGGLLVIFPAGEVATYRKGFRKVGDKPWNESAIKLIRKAKVPVIPLCIEGYNSRLFHLLGKIHPMLRTAMLGREFINKSGKKIAVNIGAPMTPKFLAKFEDIKVYGNYLRANVEYLHKKRLNWWKRIVIKSKHVEGEEIIAPVNRKDIKAELEKIGDSNKLFSSNNYELYFTRPEEIPNIMTEIGRLREITFREIGEGSMKCLDTDKYDKYYHQLFIWDTEAEQIAGAYRLGLGDKIVEKYGLRGFYTDTLFRYRPEMRHLMSKTIELGRSFLVSEYQRKPLTLLLLWKGILHVILRHARYNYLLGPVSISGEMNMVSKTLIAKYLEKHYFDKKLAAYIRPITGLKGINAPIDDSLIDGVKSIEHINKIVLDIERGKFGLPVLPRKYLQLNSRVLGFNVDPDFNHCLDALMLLDLTGIPEETIQLLSKEITDIDVTERLKKVTQEE